MGRKGPIAVVVVAFLTLWSTKGRAQSAVVEGSRAREPLPWSFGFGAGIEPGTDPLTIDASYALTERLLVGAYAQYAFMLIDRSDGDNCTLDSSCTGSDTRFGVRGELRLASGSWAVPWLGAGLGYQFVGLRVDWPSGEGKEYSASGPVASAQLGLNFELATWAFVGPVTGISIGKFASYHVRVSSPRMATFDDDITNEYPIRVRGYLGIRMVFGR